MRNLFPVSTDFAFPDSTFDNFFNGLFQPTAETQVKLPKVDIEDTGKAYVLTADLPGMAKKDITITYANDILTIGAQHKEETEEKSPETSAQAASASSDTAEKSSKAPAKEEHHFLRKERTNTVYSRQFVVRTIQRDGIEASFENGVLTITLPKQDPDAIQASQRIDIK